jgi:hypothetical protein
MDSQSRDEAKEGRLENELESGAGNEIHSYGRCAEGQSNRKWIQILEFLNT